MSKRSIALIVVMVTASMFSPLLRAQDAKWNNIPPGRAAYRDKKPTGVAPKRDLTGIWDAVQTLGVSGLSDPGVDDKALCREADGARLADARGGTGDDDRASIVHRIHP